MSSSATPAKRFIVSRVTCADARTHLRLQTQGREPFRTQNLWTKEGATLFDEKGFRWRTGQGSGDSEVTFSDRVSG